MLERKGSCITLSMPIDETYSHIWPLYIVAKFDGQPVSRVLVDNEALLNILLASMLKKLRKKKFDIFPTDHIMTHFYSTIAQPLEVISIELIVRQQMTKTVFFIIDVATTYNALLGQDWIYANRCVPS